MHPLELARDEFREVIDFDVDRVADTAFREIRPRERFGNEAYIDDCAVDDRICPG